MCLAKRRLLYHAVPCAILRRGGKTTRCVPQAVVISHGITKQESAVPPIEIERARRRRQAFEAAPPRHTHTETL
jgi:hypothetical protein